MPQPNRNPFRINEDIRNVEQVRLVGDSLEELSAKLGETIEPGIYTLARAMAIADKAELDLIETTPTAEPPICRITDYNKFLFERKKREKEMKANAKQTIIKEIRMSPDTHEHDFDFKVRHALGFLKDEDAKVKVYVQFKGRAIAFKERGELLLLKFIQAVEDVGVADGLPKLEGRRMSINIAPKKKHGSK